VRPIVVSNRATYARQGALLPPSEQIPSSVQSTRNVSRPSVPTTQGPQRVGNKGTDVSCSTSPVRTRCRPTTGRVRPVRSLKAQKMGSVKHQDRQTRPFSSELPRGTLSVKPIVAPNQPISARHVNRLPFDSGSSSMQSTNQPKDAVRPSIPTTKLPQRVGGMVKTSVRREVVRARVPTAPLQDTEHAEMARTIRKTRPPSVKQSAVGSFPKPPITTEAVRQTAPSQALRKKVIASQPSQQTESKKMPTLGGHPVTRDRKHVFKGLLNAFRGVDRPADTRKPAPEDILLPPSRKVMKCPNAAPLPSSPLCSPRWSRILERSPHWSHLLEPVASGKPPVPITHMLVPRDVNRPSYMGCRIRPAPCPPRCQDARTNALLTGFLTSTPRKPQASSPLSPLQFSETGIIAHAHTPNIACFRGCELREVLERSLDIELGHATMLYTMLYS
jgi:hypothetical protein